MGHIEPGIVITIVSVIFGSTGFWSAIMALITRKTDKKSAESKALIALLHSTIYTKATFYIKRGAVTTDEFEDLECLYQPYVSMGGNGTGKTLFERVAKLDFVSTEEAIEMDNKGVA